MTENKKDITNMSSLNKSATKSTITETKPISNSNQTLLFNSLIKISNQKSNQKKNYG